MDILKKFEEFDSDIEKLERAIGDVKKKRVEWCRDNHKEIKLLFPKKGKIYEIINIPNDYKYSYYRENNVVLYFKPLNLRFNPKQQFNYYSSVYPVVKGEVLDVNFNKLEIWEPRIRITNLKEIGVTKDILRDSLTKVYVMIDKNTGLYKIGRSKNPMKREKTLQSEKPTIELLFSHDARVKDEKVLHDMFDSKRVRGEWFNLDGMDLMSVKEYFKTKTT